MKKVNLGCGRNILPGWINVDKIEEADVRWNLNRFPYPFESHSIDYVLMKHVLEHLDDVIKVMEEVHRILKPHGVVEIIVPYYRHENAFTDPTHKHFFTERSMDYFTDSGIYNFYTKARFKVLSFEKRRHGVKTFFFPDTLVWKLEAIPKGES